MQTWPQPVKLIEIGPMFRYDRPQAGRYRQFWQFDIEAIGDAGPAIDAEIIELGMRFYRDAGLRGVEVHLNSIGDAACRPAYVAELTAYFDGPSRRAPRARARPARAQRPAPARFEGPGDGGAQRRGAEDHRPPVRRLSPSISPSVRAHLDALGVPYRLEPGLVRGLDYYTRTAFEFYVTGREGQQQAIGGGGATTAWSSSSAGARRPGSGSGSASTG